MSSVIAKCRTCGHTPLHSSDELEEIIGIPCELCHEKVYFFCTICEKWIEETICPICRLPETRPEESLGGKPPPETFVRKGVVWVGKVFVGVGCGIYVWNSTGQTVSALPIVLFGVFIGVLIGAFLDRTIGRWISIKFRKFGTIFLYPALLCVALFSASTDYCTGQGGFVYASKARAEAREQEKQDAYSALGSLVGAIKGKIEGNWSNRLACSGQEVTISVKVNISGEVTAVQVVGDSGDDACRRSAENAVYKASPLPFPDNPRFFKWLDQEFQIIFKPDI